MKRTVSEKGLVVVLFVMVLVVFSFAQRDSRKLEGMYTRNSPNPVKNVLDLNAGQTKHLAVEVKDSDIKFSR